MALSVYLYLIAYSLLLCSLISSCLASYFDDCNQALKCGNSDFSYPFGLKNSGCGDPDFQLQCNHGGGYPLINIGGDEYRILDHSILTHNSMTIMNNNLWGHKCNLSGNYSQFWLPASHFHIADTYTNLTIWGPCYQSTEELSQLRVTKLSGDDCYYDVRRRPEQGTRFCKTQLQLPIRKEYPHHKMKRNFPWQAGFEVTWYVDPKRYQSCGDCLKSHGRCGYDIWKPTTFLCYCPDGTSHSDKCPENGTEDSEDQNMSAIAIGYFVVGVAVTATGVAVAMFLAYDACKRRNPTPEMVQADGNNVANTPYSSTVPDSSLFTSTEKSSMPIGIGV